MCLILFQIAKHPDIPLVLAANRDEFHDRPTRAMAFWPDRPHILAGRDLKAGGTWMGVSRQGRFAALTNYRDLSIIKNKAPSRGGIVTACLESVQGDGCQFHGKIRQARQPIQRVQPSGRRGR